MQITENNVLSLENVIAIRRECSPNKSNGLLEEMESLFADGKIKKRSPYINVTHGIKKNPTKPVIDLEILIAVDDVSSISGDVRVIPEFRLNNAVKCTYEGSPLELSKCGEAIEKYIKDNNLEAVTPGYLLTLRVADASLLSLNDMRFELYVGIKSDEKNSL